jgi:uncharacterized protein
MTRSAETGVSSDAVIDVLLFSGGRDYVDPWHPFHETSARLHELLRESSGGRVTVLDRVDELISAPQARLIVLNAGNAGSPHPRDAEMFDALQLRRAAGAGILALHTASTLFPSVPEWERVLGGRWIRGTTMHPDYGRAAVLAARTDHPVMRGVGDFTLNDERYTGLSVGDVDVLATHVHEGQEHPLIWAHDHGGRVVYDALGHDQAAYDNAAHRRLLRNSIDWLLSPAAGAAVEPQRVGGTHADV